MPNFESDEQALYAGMFTGVMMREFATEVVTNKDGYTKQLRVIFEGPGGDYEALVTVERVERRPF